jgi:peptidyl-tRNA hydrolase, PTH1 family
VNNNNEKHLVVVGLGNPGKKYESTRHNIGNLVAKALADTVGWSLKEENRFKALVAKGKFQDFTLHVVIPTTFMNESGYSVRTYLDFYKLGPQDLVVIVDDVELPFNQMRLRPKGSSGGHNGLKSIEAQLGTQEYIRLKMGIGKDLFGSSLADYVLSLFRPDEMAQLKAYAEQGVEAIKSLMHEPIAIVMNKVNRKVKG